MKVSGISIGDRAADAANTSAVGLLIFFSRGNAKFHLEVSEHRGIVFPPFKFRDTDSTHGPQVKNPCLPHHAHSTSGPSIPSPGTLLPYISVELTLISLKLLSKGCFLTGSLLHSPAEVAAPATHRSSSPCSASSPHLTYHS